MRTQMLQAINWCPAHVGLYCGCCFSLFCIYPLCNPLAIPFFKHCFKYHMQLWPCLLHSYCLSVALPTRSCLCSSLPVTDVST